MTQAKTNLSDLPIRSLRNRIASAKARLSLMEKEMDRRERVKVYGTDTPTGLKTYYVRMIQDSSLTVQARDEADAERVVEECSNVWANEQIQDVGGGYFEIDVDKPVAEENRA
jgi:hypothetical protein